MSEDKPEDFVLRRAFMDIAKGYSIAKVNEQTAYIKHFSIFDQEELDQKYNQRLERLIRQGVISRENKLKELNASGDWTEHDERKIDEQEAFLTSLKNTKKALVIVSQMDQVQGRIEETQEELNKLRGKKESFLSSTAESFANRYLNDLSIYNSFYKDKDLSETFFSHEEFEELERKEIYELIKIYNDCFDSVSLDKIKHLALSGLFVNYFNINENSPNDLFQRPPLELSFYQVNLITYCKIFKSIFKNVPDIPDEVRDDPDQLLEFAESGHKMKEKMEEMKRKAAKTGQGRAQSIVGATKEDMENVGMGATESISPMEFLKKKGKSTFSLFDGDLS